MNGILDKLHISPSPHVLSNDSTQKIMRDVIIALLPAAIGALYYFGAHALVTIVLSVASCILAEYLWQRIMKKRVTVSDLSAVVTGILLAFNMPPEVPYWMPVIGGFFAIMLCKQIFGGLGHNFINPALGARAALLASWPTHMTHFVRPDDMLNKGLSALASTADSVSSATPLMLLKEGVSPSDINLWELLVGNRGGCIGETSVILLVIGAVYLLMRRVINHRVPVGMLGTMAVMAFLFGGNEGFASGGWTAAVVHIMSGGAVLGAFFMASDYATSPVTPKGQWMFGIGVGLLTMVIRLWGGYSEGASHAILIMNVAAPLIERYTRPKTLGSEVKGYA